MNKYGDAEVITVKELASEIDGVDPNILEYDVEIAVSDEDDNGEIRAMVEKIEWDHYNKKLIIHGF